MADTKYRLYGAYGTFDEAKVALAYCADKCNLRICKMDHIIGPATGREMYLVWVETWTRLLSKEGAH